ncbi:MAG: response regulator [Lachnospiraceae bacterium]|nr:response regulator [Lachnospiraceae bacterium]
MLKVFLVEDEVVIREGIKNSIDWKARGYDFCGEASDGEVAYSMIAQLRPDIVITDIRMPFMDGLELSRLIKQELPETQIIILSGYNEFEYAKEGIRIGISEYLLKPVSGQELLEHVDQVAEKILEKRREEELFETYRREMEEKHLQDRSMFLKELVSGRRSAGELLSMATEQGIGLSAPWYNFILVKYASEHQSSDEAFSGTIVGIEEKLHQLEDADSLLCFDRNLEGMAFLVKAESSERLAELTEQSVGAMTALFTPYSYVTYFGGIGEAVNRLTELPQCFESAQRAFAYRYLINENRFLRFDQLDSVSDVGKEGFDIDRVDTKLVSRAKLEEFLRLGDDRETVYFVEEFFRKFGEDVLGSLMFRQYLMMDTYFCVADYVEGLREGEKEKVEKIDLSRMSLQSVEQARAYMIRILSAAVKLREENATGRYRDVVGEVERYIMEQYANEELSLNLIASHVNFSPNHLSTIFSQETGQTLIKYLTDFRMNKAKELLKGTGKKSSEISQEVGYKDPHYFSYLFKKTQGMTPTQFRGGKSEEES